MHILVDRSLLDIVGPGGLFVLATPNCVNLRKRIAVPLGRGQWTAMEDWYEPDVDDLRYIARDMALREVEIFGQDWIGYFHAPPVVRRAMPVIDRALRLHAPFCSDLYLVGPPRPARSRAPPQSYAQRRARGRRHHCDAGDHGSQCSR